MNLIETQEQWYHSKKLVSSCVANLFVTDLPAQVRGSRHQAKRHRGEELPMQRSESRFQIPRPTATRF